ncbi:pectinacetylesterase family protein [Striga asiatica]|uniref:Pectin acetylesterase n=1 Tax=Striga asiatica TaxID=4170 RepID=A0A5A7PCW1_STRAF|nr:pectinacetylesterase family protein [Striga asiatica]
MDYQSLRVFSLLIIYMLLKVVGGARVNITLIPGAVSEGAVCLDGSPPGYAMDQGSGYGSYNWLIYLQGGGWCAATASCADRAKFPLGSSLKWNTTIFFDGILDQNRTFNPDFYNWNRVHVMYCDGSSFLGDVDEVDPETNLYYRGSRVFNAVINELLARGLNYADNVILTGGSAGGLATILHCDGFRSLLPNAQRVKCISDSGFFLRATNLPGVDQREDFFGRVVELHGLANFLPATCTSRMNPDLCIFPENLVEDIETPLFLLESSYDQFQITELYTPNVGGRHAWKSCVNGSLGFCNSTELELLEDFHSTFVQTLQDLDYSTSRGMFVHNCFRHGHILQKDGWKCSSLVGNVLQNKTIAGAISDWYFDRNDVKYVDASSAIRNCSSNFHGNTFERKCIGCM